MDETVSDLVHIGKLFEPILIDIEAQFTLKKIEIIYVKS
jgi:hypothetical protein